MFAARNLRWARPSRIYLIDPWRQLEDEAHAHAIWGKAGAQNDMDRMHADVVKRFSKRIERGQVVVLRELAGEAARQLDDEMLDWAYIDGDHTYEAVQADLEAYWPLVKPGGILAGDDYNFLGWWKDGVTKAVDEFAEINGLEPTITGNQFLFEKPA